MKGDPPHGPGRILLKLSGELLAGGRGTGIDQGALREYAGALVSVSRSGWRPGVVVGGGNFIRGAHTEGITRHRADHMGMLATVINGIALKDAIESLGACAGVLSALPPSGCVGAYSPDEAIRLVDSGAIAIYAGGTGNPYLTTDTAAALRAVQTGCKLLLKGTKVDGVYDSDPVSNPSAVRFGTISYDRVLALDLGVMDAAAVALCRENGLPVTVFDITDPANIARVLEDRSIGTTIWEE